MHSILWFDSLAQHRAKAPMEPYVTPLLLFSQVTRRFSLPDCVIQGIRRPRLRACRHARKRAGDLHGKSAERRVTPSTASTAVKDAPATCRANVCHDERCSGFTPRQFIHRGTRNRRFGLRMALTPLAKSQRNEQSQLPDSTESWSRNSAYNSNIRLLTMIGVAHHLQGLGKNRPNRLPRAPYVT